MAWRDGLVVSFGSVECVLTRSSKDLIDICLRGEVEDIPRMWKVVESLLEDLMKVLNKYHGTIKSISIICGHCVVLGISPPHHWIPDEAFPKTGTLVPRFVPCPNASEKDIPAALVVNIFKDGDTRDQESAALEGVTKYLQKYWKSKCAPAKLLFLDCEEVELEVYQLTWALNAVDSGGDPISNVVVEVKRPTDDWQRVQDLVKGSPFTYRGVAEEFRVAAQNKHGIGEFASCEPTRDISDEKLLPSDRQKLQDETETFAQMMNVEKIIMRLFTRHVLCQNVQERLNHHLMEHGAFLGARTLLEEILRCNYKELFLFKKTLEEFDQECLADLVPVRKADDKAFEGEPYFDTNRTLPAPLKEGTSHEQAVQSRTDECVEVYSQRNLEPPQTSHTGETETKRLNYSDDDTDNQARRFKGQYTLLHELTDEQKRCCPKEHLFGKIACRLKRIHSLGSNLRFSVDEIDDIESNRPTVEAQALKMLATWKKKKGNKATVERLVKALEGSETPEEYYREAVLGYFQDSDSD